MTTSLASDLGNSGDNDTIRNDSGDPRESQTSVILQAEEVGHL